MIRILRLSERAHLKSLGLKNIPPQLVYDEQDYAEHLEIWRRTMPEADEETLHHKAIGHIAWQQREVLEQKGTYQHLVWYLRAIVILLLILLVLVLTRPAKAQFSHVNFVNWQSQGSNISGAFFTYPFNINCLANLTCTVSGNTLSINSVNGGTGCTIPGGTGDFLYDTGTACGDVTKLQWTSGTNTITGLSGLTLDLSAMTLAKWRVTAGLTTTVNGDFGYDSTAGRWHMWQGGADKFNIAASNVGATGQPCLSNADGSCTFADPIVSGPDAVAAAPTKNPVQIGCLFLTTPATLTNNQVGEAQCDSTQHLFANVTNAFQLDATGQASLVAGGGTVAPSKVQMVGGKTNDGTAQYDIMPEGAGGRSVIVEGFAGGTAVPVSAASLPLPSGAATSANQCGTSSPCEVSATSSANSATNPLFAQPTDGTNGIGAMVNFGSTPTAVKSLNTNAAIINWGGSTLGAMANYGTSPGAVLVPGVNAFITNTPTVTANIGTTSGLALDASKCTGATGSAVPANGCYDAGNGSGNLTSRLQCDGYAFYDAATNGATQLVGLVSGKTIFVCGYSFSSSSATANTLKLVYGTGSNCATGQTAMTPGIVLQAAASTGPIGKVIPPTGFVNGLKTAASNALCVLTNAAQAAQAEVWYTQF